ncbi:hypothetical protein IQ277_02345 [Nostocales cyanobacterium LEGE 12452]|nr:hypothetical protein [Nostocales cyanobacterium LEGE 12452]
MQASILDTVRFVSVNYMKSILFQKSAALAIGAAMFAFSSVAFASTYNIEKVIHTNGLGKSKELVAQKNPSPGQSPHRQAPLKENRNEEGNCLRQKANTEFEVLGNKVGRLLPGCNCWTSDGKSGRRFYQIRPTKGWICRRCPRRR